MLNSFRLSSMARLNTEDYIQSFRPVRIRVKPSDLDMILEQDGWTTAIEGKSITANAINQIKDKDDATKWYFNPGNISTGQRILLESLCQKGVFTCVSLNDYVLREGYSMGSSTSEGLTKEWIEGPARGEHFCHPYRHVVLGFYISSPNKSLHKATLDFFGSQAFTHNVEIIDCPNHCRLFVRLSQPDKETSLDQVENSDEASLILNHNTFIAKKFGRFSPCRFFD